MKLNLKKIWLLIIVINVYFLLPGSFLGGFQLSYSVGPGDVVRISVFGEDSLDKEVIVGQDGAINYPLLGTVQISGLTTKEIEEKITNLLGADYLVNPQVDVKIEAYNSQKVLVLGEVKNPGLYPLMGSTFLLEIISRAGGITDKVGNKISIFRSSEQQKIASSEEDISALMQTVKPISIDLDDLLKKGNLTCNLLLQSGDLVFLPREKDENVLEQKVYISGKITRPGAYDYQKGLTALNACIMAGGFEKTAAPNRCLLTRTSGGQSQVLKIDLNGIKDGKQEDIQLQPGDRLYIPESFW